MIFNWSIARQCLPLLFIFALAACTVHRGNVPVIAGAKSLAPAEKLSITENITFSPVNWPETLRGDLLRPADKLIRPAVLVVHGGAWARRSRADTRDIAEKLAMAGYVVFNISHRFAPQYQFPAQLHDLQHAVRYLRTHAARLAIDPEKIAAWGYSSGAHLVALLGVVSVGDELDRPHGGQSARVQAVVAGGTPADLRHYRNSPLVRPFLGYEWADNPNIYALASPITHVTADDPPFFMYHGGADALVESEQATNMEVALQSVDVPVEVYIPRFKGHVSMFLFDDAAVEHGISFLNHTLHDKTSNSAK